MTDKLTKAHRSWLMSRVRSSETKPELLVRSLVHKLGYRFRLYDKKLPGTPDIVLKKYRTVIFVNGCFWHGHKDCKKTNPPKSNTEFWLKKIASNKERDARNRRLLKAQGWKALTIWECELARLDKLRKRLTRQLSNPRGNTRSLQTEPRFMRSHRAYAEPH